MFANKIIDVLFTMGIMTLMYDKAADTCNIIPTLWSVPTAVPKVGGLHGNK